MCGRFSLTVQDADLEAFFGLEETDGMYVPRFNGAPGQSLPVILAEAEAAPLLRLFRWGLVPSWAKDPRIGYKMINARAETILEKPAFRQAFSKQRCLVPADGFYEWQKRGKQKVPYRICLKESPLFAMAGIWESWKDAEGRPLHSFSILTTGANALVAPIHPRMPVILPREGYTPYLKGDSREALQWLQAYPADEMQAYTISSLVNHPANDGPEILEPHAYPGTSLFD